jgi:hypothetical protein
MVTVRSGQSWSLVIVGIPPRQSVSQGIPEILENRQARAQIVLNIIKFLDPSPPLLPRVREKHKGREIDKGSKRYIGF